MSLYDRPTTLLARDYWISAVQRMIPLPIPQEPGSLSVLLHRGSRPEQQTGHLTFANGQKIPIVGTAGTRDPDQWLHVVWLNGQAYSVRLFCDVVGYVPKHEELILHFVESPDAWTPFVPAAKPNSQPCPKTNLPTPPSPS